MTKKKWLPLLISLVFLFSIVIPFATPAKADTISDLKKKIEAIQNEKKQSEQQKKNLNSQINQVKDTKKSTEQEVLTIAQRIDQQQQKLENLQTKIETVQSDAKKAAVELDQAEKRIQERDVLLKDRVRLMYKHGDVDYLEVLLAADSFSDFVQRFDAIQTIIDSDKKILESNIKDRNIVASKRKKLINH
ncbi:hypothetical protein [Tepidibacillus marianensis]|uniref:coiled-coil domain-containing protein n=1 Tax=Tepidibacillus marianensis TaxID=3131995 RepID=UPI0030D13922